LVPPASSCSILYAALQSAAAAGAAFGLAAGSAAAGPAAEVAPTVRAATERPTIVRLRVRLILFTRMER
jgi:hypothetical protein